MSDSLLPTVLIVDDDRVNRTMLAELLQEDCRVILAKDGASALRRVCEEPDISLILLDVSMPEMDGYEVLRRLRAQKQTADTAVIFITAQTDLLAEERGLSLGAVDYVFKPIRPSIVRVRIRNHLKLVAQRKALEHLSERDGLTGIANRRYFDQALDRACRHAARSGERLSLAMIDVDHFKQYNDHYGHGAGDDALRKVAAVLAGFARRPNDVAARYGGEEFVILLPDVVELDTVLDRLRHNVLALGLAHATSQTAEVVTVSCGGVVTGTARDLTPASLLEQSDALLYQAKKEGRNRAFVRRWVS
ncbi:MAG: diguanylate cyclase [Acetobacteraceae bacterium]